jgi:periodic tryptophan protein 1
MITATAWVPRGFAAQFPQRYEIDDKEFERIADLARLQLEDAREDLDEAQGEEPGENKENRDAVGVGDTDRDEEMEGADDEKWVELSLFSLLFSLLIRVADPVGTKGR